MNPFDRLNAQRDVVDLNEWFSGQQRQKQPAPKPAKKPKDFWTDQISTGGGIGGSLAGAAGGAALGSIVPGIGTVIGGLLGGVLGGAAGSGGGELAENVITGEQDKLKNVGQEALLGGIFSAPPVRLAKGVIGAAKGATSGAAKEGFEKAFTSPSMIGGFAKGTADKMYAQAFTVPRRAASNLKPELTARELMNYGVGGSLDTIENASRNVLGQLGKIVDQSAAGVGGNIKVGDVTGVVNNALKGVKVTGPDKTALMERLTNIGTTGPLPGYARPSELLDVVRDLEARGFARINAGSTGLVKNPDVVDLGRAYVQAAKEIEDNLYSAINKTGSLKALQTPQTAQALNGIAKGLGDKFLAAKDVGQVRSLMAPFVRAKNLVAMTRDEAQSAGQGMGLAGRGAGAGIGAIAGGLPGAAAGFLAAPLVRGAEEAVRAPIATGAARAMDRLTGKSGIISPARQITGGIVPTTVRQGVGQNLFGGQSAEPSLEESLLQQSVSGEALGSTAEPAAMEKPAEVNPYPRENLMADIQRDPENADKYIAFYETLQKVYAPAGSELSSVQQKALTQSANGESTIAQLTDLLANAGGGQGNIGGNLASFFGSVGLNNDAKTYDDLARGSVAQIAKALGETGVLSDSDIITYSAMLPKLTDTEEVARNKIEALRQRLQGVRQNTIRFGAGSSGGLEEALMNAQNGQ